MDFVSDCEPEIDVMASADAYASFYEEVARKYPETEMIHGVDSRRYEIILKEILPFAAQGARMLDVGCNDGVYAIPYCKAGGSVYGVDISSTLIEKARRRAQGLRAQFVVGDIEVIRFPRAYDLVCMSEVLEHLRRPGRAIRHVTRALRLRGRLLVSTPSALGHVPLKVYLDRLRAGTSLLEPSVQNTSENPIGLEYGMSGYSYRHDGYYLFALRDWLEGFGFRCVRAYTTMHMPPFLGVTFKRLDAATLFLHRVPFLNLLGLTNVVVLEKVE